jgi:hypothetical protein
MLARISGLAYSLILPSSISLKLSHLVHFNIIVDSLSLALIYLFMFFCIIVKLICLVNAFYILCTQKLTKLQIIYTYWLDIRNLVFLPKSVVYFTLIFIVLDILPIILCIIRIAYNL